MSEEAPNPGSRVKPFTWAAVAVVLVFAAAMAGAIAIRHHQQTAFADQRPSGIPASISLATINLMGLSPVPASRAPAFTLTDQDGRTLPLSALRGKVIVLEFMDPHCTDICPLMSAEFADAYRDLGKAAEGVVFAAVNVNQYYNRPADMLAFSRQHGLTAIPDWHFLTGPVTALQAVWHAYDVSVSAPNPDADIVHTSIAYFIGPDGTERFVAAPMADHTSSGAAYLPPSQISGWGQGIAQVARTLLP